MHDRPSDSPAALFQPFPYWGWLRAVRQSLRPLETGDNMKHMPLKRPWIQSDPFCINLEPVEGCSNRCDFCGIKAVTSKVMEATYMSMETAKQVSLQIKTAGWGSKRLKFTMSGEPTLHPQIVEMIAMFREDNPDLHMALFSNGWKFRTDPAFSVELYEAGLNTLMLDDYSFSKVKNLNKVLEAIPDYVTQSTYKEHSPYSKHAKPMFIYNADHCEDGGHKRFDVHNVAGNGSLPNRRRVESLCSRPFRDVSILADGRNVLCCVDYRGVLSYGNVNDEGASLYDMWHSDLAYAVRKLLFHSKRNDIYPCNICDVQTMRNGLLPNNKGKKDIVNGPVLSTEEVKQCKDLIREALLMNVNYRENPFLPWEDKLKKIRDAYINPKYVRPWEKV